MASIAKYNARVVQKHDTSTNWNKAINFIPLAGEIIVYDDLGRIKIGDGVTTVTQLDFADLNGLVSNVNGSTTIGQSIYAPSASGIANQVLFSSGNGIAPEWKTLDTIYYSDKFSPSGLHFSANGVSGYIPYAADKGNSGVIRVSDQISNGLTKRYVQLEADTYYAYVNGVIPHTIFTKSSDSVSVPSVLTNASQFYLNTVDTDGNTVLSSQSCIVQGGLSATFHSDGILHISGAAGGVNEGANRISAFGSTHNTWRNAYVSGGTTASANANLTIGGGVTQSQAGYPLAIWRYNTNTSNWDMRYYVNDTGNVYAGSTFTSSRDYAEYFEWNDANINEEDRRGLFVRFADNTNKIELANNQQDLLGIISTTPSIVGNAAPMHWNKKYLTNVFGEVLTQEVYYPEEVDETGSITPAHVEIEPIINPEYDPNAEYIPRSARAEWGMVGLLGQLVVCDDGSCWPGGYCKCGKGGKATVSAQAGWRVLERLDDSHIRVFFK